MPLFVGEIVGRLEQARQLVAEQFRERTRPDLRRCRVRRSNDNVHADRGKGVDAFGAST